MSISSDRFKYEIHMYKRNHGYSSIEKMAAECLEGKGYSKDAIFRYNNGNKKLHEEDFEFFSNFFGVRKEYLAGIDDYRTEEDKIHADRQAKNIRTVFHQFLIALGYADLNMDKMDYNVTFPPNTKRFLEYAKETFEKKDISNISLICDVNKDNYIAFSTDFYESLIDEIAEFVKFKLSRYFRTYAESIYTVIDGNGKALPHPETIIPLTDGTSLKFTIQYTPTGDMTEDTIDRMIKMETIHQ